MKLHRIFALVLGFLQVAIAGAQAIPNWAAPPDWTPPVRAHLMDRAGSHNPRVGVASIQTLPTSSLPFVGVNPCRVVDTRGNGFTGAYGPPVLAAGSPRNFTLTGHCGVPDSAQAISLNVTVTNAQGPGFIVIYQQGEAQPDVSTLNYGAGQTIANAAVVSLSVFGGVTVIAGVSGADLIIDTNGYFGGGVDTENTFLGAYAGNSTMTGDENTAIGVGALFSNTTGFENTAIARFALAFNTSGNGNTATGSNALALNTIGDFNTATGKGALGGNSTGSVNTAIGHNALGFGDHGNGNTAIGMEALLYNVGDNNIGVGQQAGVNLTTGVLNIDIGSAGMPGESFTIRIGDSQTATFIAGISNAAVSGTPVLVDGTTGRLGVATSSARFKDAIQDMGDASRGLMRLRPVTFRYKPEIDPTGLEQYGLVAEEVAEVYPDLVGCDKDGRPETVRYQLLAPMLLNEVQKQHATIEEQHEQIRLLEERLVALEEESRNRVRGNTGN